MSAEATTKARQKRKADLVYLMGGKCILCGYDKCQQALEFHHIDKNTKKYGLSSGNCHSWEEDVEEVKKCALVCSNCHKEIEVFGYKTFNTFDEERYIELNELRKVKEKICKSCGKEISQGATYCSECWSIINRRVERPTREKLKDLRMERGLTLKETALRVGLTRNAIANYEANIRQPSLETLKALCKLFEVSADYLLGLED